MKPPIRLAYVLPAGKMCYMFLEALYVLLERAVREYDTEAAAALRWAIFYLENYPQA